MSGPEDPRLRDLRLRRRALEISIAMPEDVADAHAVLSFAIDALWFVNPTGLPKLVPIAGGAKRARKSARTSA